MVLEIKTKKYDNVFIIHLKTINSLPVNSNRVLLKVTIFQNIKRISALLYIIANHFNVCLNMSYILIFASVLNLLQLCFGVEISKKISPPIDI